MSLEPRLKSILALVTNPATHDARVIKEAESLAAAGYRITVLAEKAPGLPDTEERNGVCYRRIALPWTDVFGSILRKGVLGTPMFGAPYRLAALIILPFLPLVVLRRSERLVRWARRRRGDVITVEEARGPRPRAAVSAPLVRGLARLYTYHLMRLVLPLVHCERYEQAATDAIVSLRPDAIHAHDIDTLPAAVLVGARLAVPVIYDAHELETGRADRVGWSVRALSAMIERCALRHVARTVTVSEGIARCLADRYGIAEPTVVLNSPTIDTVEQTGKDLRGAIGLPAETPLAVYVGLVTFARGIPEMLKALSHAGDLHLALVGPREEQVAAALAEQASLLGVRERLHIVDPVAPHEVPSFIASASVGLVTLPATGLSYQYALPNKLFEMVLAGVPVVVARLHSMQRFVEEHRIGLAVDSSDPAAIAAALQEIVRRPERFRPDTQKLQQLRLAFGWPAQARRLTELYQGLWPATPAPAAGA